TTHECAAHRGCAPAPAAAGAWRSAHSSENPEARASDGLGATEAEGLDQAVPATAAAHVAQAAPLPPVARLADARARAAGFTQAVLASARDDPSRPSASTLRR